MFTSPKSAQTTQYFVHPLTLSQVNLPVTDNGQKNYLHIRIDATQATTEWGSWNCCTMNHRAAMDTAIDSEGAEIASVFQPWHGGSFTRDSRCIINGWEVCQ
jgi:hypothetical protein